MEYLNLFINLVMSFNIIIKLKINFTKYVIHKIIFSIK